MGLVIAALSSIVTFLIFWGGGCLASAALLKNNSLVVPLGVLFMIAGVYGGIRVFLKLK